MTKNIYTIREMGNHWILTGEDSFYMSFPNGFSLAVYIVSTEIKVQNLNVLNLRDFDFAKHCLARYNELIASNKAS